MAFRVSLADKSAPGAVYQREFFQIAEAQSDALMHETV
jgi:hypothetical protein